MMMSKLCIDLFLLFLFFLSLLVAVAVSVSVCMYEFGVEVSNTVVALGGRGSGVRIVNILKPLSCGNF